MLQMWTERQSARQLHAAGGTNARAVLSSHFLIVKDIAQVQRGKQDFTSDPPVGVDTVNNIKETCYIEKQHTLHLQAGKITSIKSIKAMKS